MTHTLTEVREIAARLLADKGEDFIYEAVADDVKGITFCRYYTVDGQPSCFVGHVIDIWQEGVDQAKAADLGSGTSAQEVIERAGIECERPVIEYLNTVQDHQDSGVPWGRAVLMAEHNVGLHPEPVCVTGCAACEEGR